ncbi:MAG TPA: hypothetical protein VGH33_03375 [Isosphaeraceae bacterium]
MSTVTTLPAAAPRVAAPATGGGASTTVVVPQAAPAGGSTGTPQTAAPDRVAIPTPSAPLGFVNAGTLIDSASPDLTPGALANVALANAGSEKGIGLEPNVALDEQSDYIHHLNELRRINAGDDASDLPGYGLYLVRIPISLLPSRESSRGVGPDFLRPLPDGARGRRALQPRPRGLRRLRRVQVADPHLLRRSEHRPAERARPVLPADPAPARPGRGDRVGLGELSERDELRPPGRARPRDGRA